MRLGASEKGGGREGRWVDGREGGRRGGDSEAATSPLPPPQPDPPTASWWVGAAPTG